MLRASNTSSSFKQGFTLVELSIVLVIIGLLVGGVIVGKALIEAATIRSQISQIDQFQLAVKNFKLKYNCLPGDCFNAANFGFVTRAGSAGRGDGNGLLMNISGYSSLRFSYEFVLFWRDLSDAGMIAESMLGTDTTYNNSTVPTLYFPPAKIGQSAFVYGWSGGYIGAFSSSRNDGFHYFGIVKKPSLFDSTGLAGSGGASFTVAQAYAVDSKIDDGLPQQGNVLTIAAGSGGSFQVWASGSGANGMYDSTTLGPVTSASSPATATAASATTCYDNGNTPATTEQYSMSTSNGNGLNCFLSFKMQ